MAEIYRRAVLVVNGLIAIGIQLAILSVSVTREQTRWLAEHLSELDADPSGAD